MTADFVDHEEWTELVFRTLDKPDELMPVRRGRRGRRLHRPFTADLRASVLELAREACSNAIADAGLARADVDGIASFMVMHDSVPTQAVATVLGLPQLRFSLDIDLGGQAPCHLVAQAAAAVTTGQAEAVWSTGR